ncbi:GAF domain-containing protein [Sphingomonas sp. ASY06-1R]|uniref:GAF domain-containing protein n=1 Tax=Sphingomonas sp. ASY06-1R TaxID=3445771 RepID=UPI003FA263AF
MQDELAAQSAALGDNDKIRAILEEVCQITQMGFSAVARVTDSRWIVCQRIDRIEFGLKPGDELDLQTTICDEIRESGQAVVIDHVSGNPDWRTHHTPILYGFESYVSIPILLDGGTFFGTLCAIDPRPRLLSAPATVASMERLARAVAGILSSSPALQKGGSAGIG